MITVITYGTFDLFHIGHVNLLRRLRALGDRLVVGCSTDEFNAQKGKKAVMPYAHRAEILRSCRYVDGVFPETQWEQKPADIRREGAAIFAMGDDWVGKFDDLDAHCQVIYLPRTEDISSTELKEIVHAFRRDELQRIRAAAHNLAELIDKFQGSSDRATI